MDCLVLDSGNVPYPVQAPALLTPVDIRIAGLRTPGHASEPARSKSGLQFQLPSQGSVSMKTFAVSAANSVKPLYLM